MRRFREKEDRCEGSRGVCCSRSTVVFSEPMVCAVSQEARALPGKTQPWSRSSASTGCPEEGSGWRAAFSPVLPTPESRSSDPDST